GAWRHQLARNDPRVPSGGRKPCQDGRGANLPTPEERDRRRARRAPYEGGQQGRLHDGLADQREPRRLLRAEFDSSVAEDAGKARGKIGIEIEIAADG